MAYLIFFIKTLFSDEKDMLTARKYLFNQHVFSLPGSAKEDRLIGVRQLVRVLRALFQSKTCQEHHSDSANAIYILNNDAEHKIQFTERNIKGKVNKVFVKNEALGYATFSEKIIALLIICWLAYFVIPACFFSSKRINYGVLFEEVVAGQLIANRLNGVQKMYMFYPHEPGSNLLALFLRKRHQIRVTKILLPNPIFMFNKEIISEEIACMFEYQKEEVKHFDVNSKLVVWDSEYDQSIRKNYPSSNNKKVCYYSHASWLRVNEDHNIPYFNEAKMELELLEWIKINHQLFKEISISVSLHPKEKMNEELKQKSMKYYAEIFGEHVQFSDSHASSLTEFQNYEIGFGAFSTVLFQRIYGGYKTFMVNTSIEEFPLLNSKMNKFVVKDYSLIPNEIEKLFEKEEIDIYDDCKDYTYDILENQQ